MPSISVFVKCMGADSSTPKSCGKKLSELDIAKYNSNRIIRPIIRPKGKLLVKPCFSSATFMLSIITTNRNNTATAPTYTITNVIAINSAPSIKNITEALKNAKINISTEYTGLRLNTTVKLDATSKKLTK